MNLQTKKIVTVLLILTLMVSFPPKRSDAIVLILTQIISVVTIVLDAIILCAVFCVGDGGSTATEVTCEAGDVGTSCNATDTCSDGSTSDIPGTWTSEGSGSCTCRPNLTACSPANYCNMKNTGIASCGSCYAANGEVVTAPSDSLCVENLSDNALSINPPLVRNNGTATLVWNVGSNYPADCTLEGPHISNPFAAVTEANALSFQMGTIEINPVTGPHNYTLTCRTSSISKQIRILPAFEEV
ncbi:MAG: hypothetical protein ACI92I_000344 [Acidimicrobiales bacterium]|jgi:hypothetical protein